MISFIPAFISAIIPINTVITITYIPLLKKLSDSHFPVLKKQPPYYIYSLLPVYIPISENLDLAFIKCYTKDNK